MKRERGFTLIEILVVIAILVILIVISIPSYYRYIEGTKRARVIASAKQCVNNAVALMAEDPSADLSSAPVPENCTRISAESCVCSEGNFTARCELDSSGNNIYCYLEE